MSGNSPVGDDSAAALSSHVEAGHSDEVVCADFEISLLTVLELEPKLESVVNLVVCDVVECAANGRDVIAEYHARLVDDVYAPVIEHTAAVLFYASPVGGNTAASVNS